MAMKPEDYLKLRYTRQIIQEEDGSWRAEISEFPGCFSVGDSDIEALSGLGDVAYAWLESMIETGQSIPKPPETTDYSGRLLLRMGKTLHQKAARSAEADGISLNAFIVNCLAECLGAGLASRRREYAGLTSTLYRTTSVERHVVLGTGFTIFANNLIVEPSAISTIVDRGIGVKFSDVATPLLTSTADQKGYYDA